MLTLKDFQNVLVSYHKDPDELVAKVDYTTLIDDEGNPVPRAILETVKGEKRGVLVAIGPGIIGWSLCNVKPGWTNGIYHEGDKFDKAKGIDLALRRAKIAQSLDLFGKTSFYQKVPFTLQEEFDKMIDRSFSYFQVPESEG